MEWYIGCSGYHYKEWKDNFYPPKLPQRLWLEHYNNFFKTLELNVTFYRFPQLSFLENWYNISPADYSFAVKVPRAITHYQKFINSEKLLSDFYNVITLGLKEKLSVVLFQLPPNIYYSKEKLKVIINSTNKYFKNVIEFRHESWWRQDVYDELAFHNIAFCGMSHPTLPKDVIANTSLLYYRMHGCEQLYVSCYSTKEIQQLVDDIQSHVHVEEAYIYFNNTAQVNAVNNALEMIELVKSEK